jgi:hypothetical protein
MSDLEAILRRETGEEKPQEESNEPAVEAKPEALDETETPEAPEPEVKAKDEPKTPPPGDDGKVPIQALLEEREKRQQYERELKEFREQQEKAKQSAPKLPDYFEDPEGYNAAVEKLVQERVSGLEQKVNQQMSAAWLSMSERAAKARYQDFDEKLAAFEQEARNNPVLAAQMMQAPDPGDYVYQTGKKLLALSTTPDLDTLREQMREELRAELMAEMKQGEEQKKAKLAQVPRSLSNEQSAAGPRQPEWRPTQLEDVLRR